MRFGLACVVVAVVGCKHKQSASGTGSADFTTAEAAAACIAKVIDAATLDGSAKAPVTITLTLMRNSNAD